MNFLKDYIKNHRLFLTISFILWLCASFLGIYLAFGAQKDIAKNVAEYITSLADAKKGFGAIFKNGLITNLKYCFFISISSSFFILFPATLLLICFKGFSAGFTSMFLIRLFGLKGIGASIWAIVFPLFLSLPALFLLFGECLEHPFILFKQRKKLTYQDKSRKHLAHIGKIFIIYLLLCLVSFLEAALSPVCLRLLN